MYFAYEVKMEYCVYRWIPKEEIYVCAKFLEDLQDMSHSAII